MDHIPEIKVSPIVKPVSVPLSTAGDVQRFATFAMIRNTSVAEADGVAPLFCTASRSLAPAR
jgi:hypothetical protein